MSETKDLTMTPGTTLTELCDVFPRVQLFLYELVPNLKLMQIPAVREAVYRTTSLERVAEMAGVPVSELIRGIRKYLDLPEDQPQSTGEGVSNAPEWVRSGKIVSELDARPMLAQGQHPKGQVAEALSALGGGEIYLLITPFVPGPLIELGKSLGCQTWTRQRESGRVETYFGK